MQPKVPARICALPGITLSDTKPVHTQQQPSEKIETLLNTTQEHTATHHHDDWSRSGKFFHHRASYTGHH